MLQKINDDESLDSRLNPNRRGDFDLTNASN
jgi:hypothetical protein